MIEQSYRMVMGEDYKLNLIKSERVIYKEKGKYASKALVKHSRLASYDKEITVEIPTIEELMYYIVKGEEINVKADCR
ncbi:MAG: hypothetical protein ACERKZ_20890 [Lachnotalea sp.]